MPSSRYRAEMMSTVVNDPHGGEPAVNAPYIFWRTIRFGDTDPAGIVYTPRFGDFCMEAIEVWLNDLIGLNWANVNLNEGLGTPFVHMEIDFFSRVYANDSLGVAVFIEKIGRTSVAVRLEGIRRPPESSVEISAFRGKFVFCLIENSAGSIPIPEKFRSRLESYLQATMPPADNIGEEK